LLYTKFDYISTQAAKALVGKPPEPIPNKSNEATQQVTRINEVAPNGNKKQQKKKEESSADSDDYELDVVQQQFHFHDDDDDSGEADYEDIYGGQTETNSEKNEREVDSEELVETNKHKSIHSPRPH
jgi:hypothetical protein